MVLFEKLHRMYSMWLADSFTPSTHPSRTTSQVCACTYDDQEDHDEEDDHLWGVSGSLKRSANFTALLSASFDATLVHKRNDVSDAWGKKVRHVMKVRRVMMKVNVVFQHCEWSKVFVRKARTKVFFYCEVQKVNGWRYDTKPRKNISWNWWENLKGKETFKMTEKQMGFVCSWKLKAEELLVEGSPQRLYGTPHPKLKQKRESWRLEFQKLKKVRLKGSFLEKQKLHFGEGSRAKEGLNHYLPTHDTCRTRDVAARLLSQNLPTCTAAPRLGDHFTISDAATRLAGPLLQNRRLLTLLRDVETHSLRALSFCSSTPQHNEPHEYKRCARAQWRLLGFDLWVKKTARLAQKKKRKKEKIQRTKTT